MAQSSTEAEVTQAPAKGLISGSFFGLLVTQFLGSANDNMFRWLAIGVGKDYVPEDQQALILSAGLASFVLPYLLLAAPAGYLADRYSKRTVIVACKVGEIAVMLLGLGAIVWGNAYALMCVVFLMGSQSALFGPSKFGSIPEMLPATRISAANGVMGLVTVIATVIGAAAGNYLYDFTQPYGTTHLWASTLALLGTAGLGLAASLLIHRLPIANHERTFPIDFVSQTIRDLRTLAASTAMLRVALGIALFWALGSLVQLNIDQFGFEGDLTEQKEIVPLLMSLVFGVALGSVLAGVLSGGKVELGLLPLGAAGITVSSLLLFTVDGSLAENGQATSENFLWACVFLFTLGASAGTFNVPLESYMQHRSPRKSRGSILAANNFIAFLGMLITAVLFYLLRKPTADGDPLFTAREIFLLCGGLTLPVAGITLWLLPQSTFRFLMWLLSNTVYRVRVVGHENLKEESGALLVANHVSWVDGLLLLVSSSRPIRMIAYGPYVDAWWGRWLARTMGVIPIYPGKPKRLRQSMEEARQAIREGELVCIFPEGAITRTGDVGPFKPGMFSLVKGTDAPIVPVYLDQLWGSIFSYRGGRLFSQRPQRWPYPVAIHFGRPIEETTDADTVRRRVQELGVQAVQTRHDREMIPPRSFLRMCRKYRRREKVVDSTGVKLTGGDLLLRSLILRRLLNREVFTADERYVGVLIPPSSGGVVVNAALPLAGRVAVNLNYTVTSQVMNACLADAGIKHVLTTRKVMEKFDFDLDAELVYLDDLREKVTTADKLAAFVQARLMPLGMLERRLGLTKLTPDDVLTVIFTSGSTAQPKGVLLSNRNVASNVQAIDEMIRLNDDDVLLGTLPFFHSFGFTCTMWTVLTLCPKGAYHFSPLDARQVAKLCQSHKVTIIMSTPTFLRSYMKRCSAEDFASLDLAVAGAEKLPADLTAAFEKKFGVVPQEGYGTTELAPLVSVNVPEGRATTRSQNGSKPGSVGRPVPGVLAKILDPETGEELPAGEDGMLYIKGPNVMLGYLNRPEQTAEVLQDGWYKTGDIGHLDEDGFIFITGRLSRFSKLGGEMVPHIKIEEALAAALGDAEDEEGDPKLAVTAVSDAKKGERIVVLHTEINKTPDELRKALADQGLPNLFIPALDSFRQVDEIPILGSGKLDLKALKAQAEELFAGSETTS